MCSLLDGPPGHPLFPADWCQDTQLCLGNKLHCPHLYWLNAFLLSNSRGLVSAEQTEVSTWIYNDIFGHMITCKMSSNYSTTWLVLEQHLNLLQQLHDDQWQGQAVMQLSVMYWHMQHTAPT